MWDYCSYPYSTLLLKIRKVNGQLLVSHVLVFSSDITKMAFINKAMLLGLVGWPCKDKLFHLFLWRCRVAHCVLFHWKRLSVHLPPMSPQYTLLLLCWIETHTQIYAQCRSVVHNVVLYPWSGAQRRSHKSTLTLRLTSQVPLVHHGAQCRSVVHNTCRWCTT